MTIRREQLYRLLPAIHQTLDQANLPEDQKGPLRELLSVIGEQVNLLEDDLQRWYANWFIETCEDWVVPYIGDLVGYQSAAKELDTHDDPESPLNRAVVFPRREVADAIALRRRKGTLALLEELSRRIVGWPARAVEYRDLVSGTASTNFLHRRRSSTVDVRDLDALALLGSAFERLPRSVDVRRINSHRTRARHNLPALGLFVYRRKIDSATIVPARVLGTGNRFTFDVQGLAVPLHTLPRLEASPFTIAEMIHLPLPISRRMLKAPGYPSIGVNETYYGLGRSLFVVAEFDEERAIVPAERIVIGNLDHWNVDWSQHECDAVLDPESGRLAFPPDHAPNKVWTTYHYGRAAFIGGGEYERVLEGEPLQPVVDRSANVTLADALTPWRPGGAGQAGHAIIEIADNEEHNAESEIEIGANQTLEIRAANRCRPCLHISDRSGQILEKCHFHGHVGSELVLDGLLFGGGEVLIDGEFSRVLIRHCTLTPGKTQLVIRCNETEVRIEKSIVGRIVTLAPEIRKPAKKPGKKSPPEPDCSPSYNEPIQLRVYDSVIDGVHLESDPLGPPYPHGKEPPVEPALQGAARAAHAKLTAVRTTIFGTVQTQEVERIENSILIHRAWVENCQVGCIRFSYLPPDSRTPALFHSQPSLAIERLAEQAVSDDTDDAVTPESEALRVKPRFLNTTYGQPDYARLADTNAAEILQGADDEGEMGVYHNEFFSQRAAHLRTRVEEFIPAGNDIQVFFET